MQLEKLFGDPKMNEKLKTVQMQQSSYTQTIESVTKELVAEFNGGIWNTSLNKEGIPLQIPTDTLEKSRGSWVRHELSIWWKKHAQELYPVIPYLERIVNDYDPITGEYWKPPTQNEAEEKIPDSFREEWEKANKALATKLYSVLPNAHMLTQLTSSFHYGANQDKHTRADREDGLSLAFALVTLSSPNTAEYRDSVDQQIHTCAQLARSGNPSDFVKTVREILAEATRLNIPVRWHVARQIIDIMSTRNTLFAQELGPMQNSCQTPDDSAEQFDAMLTKMDNTNIKVKEVNGDSWWVTHPRAHDSSSYAGNPKEICRYGTDCRNQHNGKCCRKHIVTKSNTRAKPTGKSNGKPLGKSKRDDSNMCNAENCIDDKSPKGGLCNDCYTQAKKRGFYINKNNKRIKVGKDPKSKKPKTTANAAKAVKAETVGGQLAITGPKTNTTTKQIT